LFERKELEKNVRMSLLGGTAARFEAFLGFTVEETLALGADVSTPDVSTPSSSLEVILSRKS
jgi:hypothetical protein